MENLNDLISAVELTAEARMAAEAYEGEGQSFARYLPSVTTDGISIELTQTGSGGLVEEAAYRAFSAEPEIAGGELGDIVTLRLPALGQKRPLTEWAQLMDRNAGEEVQRAAFRRTARLAGAAIAATAERQRVSVAVTGAATIAGRRFQSTDDFGRAASHTQTAPQLWTDAAVSRTDYLRSLVDVYVGTNGVPPGAIVMGSKVYRALLRGSEFTETLANGATRPMGRDAVFAVLDDLDIPVIERYDLRTSAGPILPENVVLLMPPAGPTVAEEPTALGAMYWGRTLTSGMEQYGILEAEQPGIIVGAFRETGIPHTAWVESDAIALPALANPNLTLAATVL
ncbi:hypothetical protein FDF08_09750 [Micrococcus luteus]|nr:hypothetical protein FDF08_09750 [Micrococcus luteus]